MKCEEQVTSPIAVTDHTMRHLVACTMRHPYIMRRIPATGHLLSSVSAMQRATKAKLLLLC
jgi:hypothetical protein